jgi:tRNA threonylcarbamoyladenosine biosynthesis protein TsaB
MKILALESSAKAASVALTNDRTLVAQYFQNSGLTHSRTLLKMAEDLLHNLDLTVSDMDLIAVAGGPGSFTGIRIGVAAAIGLAWGADKPVCGVSTLEAMVYLAEYPGHVLCPVMDARRGQVYTASFEWKDGRPCRLCPDRAVSVETLIEEARGSHKPYLLLGDGAQLVYDAFVTAGVTAELAMEPIRQQSAWGVALASLDAPTVSPLDLQPTYLRASQAERERSERLASGPNL